MNAHFSSSDEYEHGRSFDTLLVRSFRPTDRPAVLQLHAAAAPGLSSVAAMRSRPRRSILAPTPAALIGIARDAACSEP